MALIDADVIARQVVEPHQPAYRKIVAYFGKDILESESQQIDRVKLGARVFSNSQDRKRLNAITHPYIRREMLRQVLIAFLSLKSLVILDVPLLIESKLHHFVHTVLVVSCSLDIQKKRLMARNNYSETEAEQRIQSQMSLAEKRALAQSVIENSQDPSVTQEQIKVLFEKELKPNRLTTWLYWMILSVPASVCLAGLSLWKWLGI